MSNQNKKLGPVLTEIAKAVIDRGHVSKETVEKFIAGRKFCEDDLWEKFIGPAVDQLEDEILRMPALETSSVLDILVCEDGYALGRIEIGGVDFHAHFIRVTEKDGAQVCDSNNKEVTQAKWDDFCGLDDIAFKTVQLPGLDGDWVCVIHPYGDWAGPSAKGSDGLRCRTRTP